MTKLFVVGVVLGMLMSVKCLAIMPEQKSPIVQKIIKIARSSKVEPALALAVADMESRLNPKAEKYEPKLKTYSVGLFQLLLTTARLEFAFNGSRKELADPDTNINFGIRYLTRCIEERSVKLFDIACCYNAGFNAKDSFCAGHAGVRIYLGTLRQKVALWQNSLAASDI